MRRLATLVFAAMLAFSLRAFGAEPVVPPASPSSTPAFPATADDAAPMPCAPGVIRPRHSPPPPVVPSKILLQQEAEVVAMRARANKFQRDADEAVRETYRREREAVKARFARRVEPIAERERVQRAAAITEFSEFLSRRGDSPAAAEATFRLAELEFEDATDRFLAEHSAWERASTALPPPDAASIATGEMTTPKLVATAEPHPDYTQAIGTYRILVDRFNGYGHRDGALYMIAYCLGEMGQPKGARDTFEELARSEPASAFVPEAWLRVGEYHFDRREFAPAIAAYEKASAFPASPYFDKALYKLAWSWYRSADAKHPNAWEESAKTFARLIDVAPSSDLRSESLQYLAIIYSDHGGLDGVRARVSGRPWGNEVVRALAQVWFEQANWKDAAEAFRVAVETEPDADDAPKWLGRRAACLFDLGRWDEAATAREMLFRTYGPTSRWAQTHGGSQQVIRTAEAIAEPALLQAAVWRHQHAQETGSETDYARAAELYGMYLGAYPGRPAAYDLSFYRGECLYFAGRFDDAAAAYAEVLEFSNDNRWHAEAGFSRLKALEKRIGPATVAGSDPAPDAAMHPMTPQEKAFGAATDQFTCVASTDWRVPEALHRAAQVYYGNRRLRAARSHAEAVVGAAPGEDLAAYSAALIVDAWRLEGNWAEVESAATRFAAKDLGRTPTVIEGSHASLTRVALEAGFQVARALDGSGAHAQAAVKFLAIANGAPASDLAPKALFAAAESQEKAGAGRSAGDTFERLVKSYPSSPLAPAAAFRTAQSRERILLLGAAAEAYAEVARKRPGAPDAPAAAWNAAVVLDAANRPADSAAAYERYASAYPRAADATDARFRAAELWTRADLIPTKGPKSDHGLKAWRALVATPSLDGPRQVIALAGLSRAERAARLPGDAEARRALEAQAILLSRNEGTPESARAAAEAGLARADELLRSYESVKPSLPEAKLKSTLRVKHDLLVQLQTAYLAVAAAGDPEAATEALHRIGQSYTGFEAALLGAPVPPMDAADAVTYRAKVAENALPILARAIEAFQRNVDAAETAKVATEWTARSRAALAALDASKVPPRIGARPLPPPDLWALPEMAPPPAVTVADSGAGMPAAPAGSDALRRGIALYESARSAGDLDGLRAAETQISTAVNSLGVRGTSDLADAVATDASDAAVALAAVGWLDLGVAREAIGDHDGAAVAFQTALVLKKDFAPAAAGNIAALARKGDARGAVTEANAWLSRHPADAKVRVNLAGATFLRNDIGGALDAAADALAFDAGLGVARRAVVEFALDARRPELALFAARQAVAMAPDDPRAAETLGSALRRAGLDRIHGRAAGREALAAAAARFPNDARLAHAAGVAALEDGDPVAARKLLEAAALHAPSTETWIALADARRVTGDTAGAGDAASKALARQPGAAGALENLGLANADALQFAGAEAAFKEYLERTQGSRSADDPVQGWLDDTLARREKQEAAP